MAKQLSFADKIKKGGKTQEFIVMCPDTNKETKVITVRLVESIKTEKGNYKYQDRIMKVYESTYKPYKG
ncbi:MAG: hypothetical protein OZ913_01570 [Ignavibacteriaceae bacterium]|jgi:hypothetical protein|nr:MAG: hypothetical protein EDM69_07895 [Chlorobiota bacterium]KXK04598.1 MAG: hypothetical protein UZ04_CHB001000974 [Chlorobi bacterium OLB4]MBV6399538.1 hypothetical protein [Ignavibacteria bacterium]MCC6886618.1 hypothetical protein [Ignavibacteriales bacterium]MCE7953243.1 hypothetical protein [Chlorobi bacterium CHB7]MEB2328974.1 hypothetical protein [Ignavibacteriaceae bacterium]OQY76510.1 MAG: hypothetical protein B6D43_10045 [Ignavibacteriales bacterium UTCHB1]RIK50107.1 MAG: hypot